MHIDIIESYHSMQKREMIYHDIRFLNKGLFTLALQKCPFTKHAMSTQDRWFDAK